jgi:hypothetical protein
MGRLATRTRGGFACPPSVVACGASRRNGRRKRLPHRRGFATPWRRAVRCDTVEPMRTAKRAIAALFVAGTALCQDARSLLAEAQKRAHSDSVRYRGVLQTFDQAGTGSEKSWVFERLGPRGRSRILVRFLAPEEVKGVEILILNLKEGPSGQWLWTPASGRVRRITAPEVRLYGGEFGFDDLEEPDLTQFTGRLLEASAPLDGAACWKIELRPRPGNPSPYTYSYLWLRKDNYVMAQMENYAGQTMSRRIASRGLREVQGRWTPREVEVTQPGRRARIVFRVDEAEYNVPLVEAAFKLPGPLPAAAEAPAVPTGPCAYMLQPQSVDAPAAGIAGAIIVSTQPGCTWTATATARWISILAGSGKGPTGAISFRAAPNTTPAARTGAIAVGNRTIAVKQAGAEEKRP